MVEIVVGIVAALLAVLIVTRAIRIVPQARAGNVERLGRYTRTLQPGLNIVIPFIDRVRPLIDVREQVISFEPRAVITEDNLSVKIDTVLYFQVTNPRDAAYEIADYISAIEQLTVTTLRNVIGSLDLEKALTSREYINSTLRGVLDEASGKWGIRVNRVELKAIDPPPTIKESMEKQMRAEREKRAAILNAEGVKRARILTAEGDRQAAILNAEGQSKAIDIVFQAVHRNDADPKLLAYKYLDVLPEIAKGQGNSFFVIPGEVTAALNSVSKAFGAEGTGGARRDDGAAGRDEGAATGSPDPDGPKKITCNGHHTPMLTGDAPTATDQGAGPEALDQATGSGDLEKTATRAITEALRRSQDRAAAPDA
jgi:regulator of protease activity HflC (stomatin/prohibitin superfamily)